MKDREFFEKVVLPFIHAKFEKTLVDEFLLGESLEKYTDPKYLDRINCFELCLVIWSLKNNG